MHLDIKPDNLLLFADGRVKLCASISEPVLSELTGVTADFGLAKLMGDKTMTTDRSGTVEFQAPEIRSGRFNAYSADIYAVGGESLVYLTDQADPFSVMAVHIHTLKHLHHFAATKLSTYTEINEWLANLKNFQLPAGQYFDAELNMFLTHTMNAVPNKRHTATALLNVRAL